MNTKEIGNRGEDIASVYLENNKYTILDRNWKTRWCEIDIIATCKQVVYFVEVKYRKNDAYGNGLDYITAKKLAQMRFAAEFWVHNNNFNGDYRLAAVSVTGDDVLLIDDL